MLLPVVVHAAGEPNVLRAKLSTVSEVHWSPRTWNRFPYTV
jgi:hypothetical protein